jgi:hypothetical protein
MKYNKYTNRQSSFDFKLSLLWKYLIEEFRFNKL